MQYMVVERFRDGDPVPVYRRFREQGRMAPDGPSLCDGLGRRGSALAVFRSWNARIPRCSEQWTARWADVVEFEIFPVDHLGRGRRGASALDRLGTLDMPRETMPRMPDLALDQPRAQPRYLTSARLTEAGLPHLFTTRHFPGVTSPRDPGSPFDADALRLLAELDSTRGRRRSCDRCTAPTSSPRSAPDWSGGRTWW